ncbi:hypothetical protein V8G56_13205 [Gaetbulibacter aquiaggeris]|uniref:DUF502 domain-containing protein n=1 Tax=Gaetbulibacter aquiaggeris TaxID=1735373 RepID=A0ABW7MS82_9FLAO
MKTIVLFIRTTITGGILFLLPIGLLIILFNKVFNVILKISEPISHKLPTIIFGLKGAIIITLFLLIIICFISGLLFRSSWVKKNIVKLEENVLDYVPGYALIKSITADSIGEQIDHKMTPILIKDENSWNLAFLVEEGVELSTVFIPDAPRYDAGEVRIIPTKLIKKLNVSANVFSRSIKNYGKGAINWLN